ncbi:MAG: glutamate synthase large subunit, partial [Actinomycetota bacterium]
MDPRDERDACGIGFVADVKGRASRTILDSALQALSRMRHRGAVAADAKSGDGAGVLVPLPRRFLAWAAAELRLDAPSDRLGVAMSFLDGRGEDRRRAAREALAAACASEGISVAGWREVPTEPDALGERARACAPRIEQAILLAPDSTSIDEAE